MRRRNDDDSSLELLLDTMCNTFGGVMFIAISLAVMLSMRGAVSSVTADTETKIREAEARINELQLQLEQINAERKKAEAFLQERAEDPRMRLVKDIAYLEQTIKTRKPQQLIAGKKRELARIRLQDVRNKNLPATEQLRVANEQKQKLSVRLREQELKLKKMQSQLQSKAQSDMVFSTLSQKEAAPYFILVNDGKVWAVGPDITKTSYSPAPAVSWEARKGRYVCRPKPGHGIELFTGDTLSAELLDMLRALPSDRIPNFVISPGDAANFVKMRELLKTQKIFHGFRLQKRDVNEFDYQFSNDKKGQYEY